MKGQCDDLGGGVFKKRLNKNLSRSIIVSKGGQYWVFAFLYHKKDRSNIDQEELSGFRMYAALFAQKTPTEIAKDIELQQLVEICHDE